MNASLIKTEEQYEENMAEFKQLFRNKKRTPEEEERKEILSLLIQKWENDNYSMEFEESDPIDLIEFIMDQHGLTPADMQEFLGAQSKVSEVLTRKRPLTLTMIRKLSRHFNISADLLIKEYPLAV